MCERTRALLNRLKSIFPLMTHTHKKGDNGRIAVIGGSFEFTGAPFYSAISSLKVGGDLAHIFCSKSSSPSIKSYSPEIIVHPVFVSDEEVTCSRQEVSSMHQEWIEKIKTWDKAIHAWIIGPGLGRDTYMHDFFPILIRNMQDNCLAIFDADGIYYLCQHPELFEELKRFRTILTPNLREVGFLQKHYDIDLKKIGNIGEEEVAELSSGLAIDKHFKLIIKGQHDLVLGADRSFIIRTEGGMKRCGGMGDILAGVAAVCSLWDF